MFLLYTHYSDISVFKEFTYILKYFYPNEINALRDITPYHKHNVLII